MYEHSTGIKLAALTLHTVANNFWGKEDAGVSPLLERMHNAKTTSDELKSYYTGAWGITPYPRKTKDQAD